MKAGSTKAPACDGGSFPLVIEVEEKVMLTFRASPGLVA